MRTNQSNNFILKISLFTAVLVCMTLAFFILYWKSGSPGFRSAAITMLTFSYHFAMRILVGKVVDCVNRHRPMNPDAAVHKIFAFEPGLYSFIKVKRWKKYAVTAVPESFDLSRNSLEKIRLNMLQAEVVHKVIMLLALLPILLIIPWGSVLVFVLTSVASSLMDLPFVIIQRYNRWRINRLLARLRCTLAECPSGMQYRPD